jgi:hypothetical protein
MEQEGAEKVYRLQCRSNICEREKKQNAAKRVSDYNTDLTANSIGLLQAKSTF